jgi:hypothetical protein
MRGLLLILLAGLALAGSAVAATDAAVDATTGLIIDTGWNDVRAHCGACHSYSLVTQQRADRPTWQGWIRWMQETQNLWQFDPATEASILDYLAKNYPPQAHRRRAPIPPELMPGEP